MFTDDVPVLQKVNSFPKEAKAYHQEFTVIKTSVKFHCKLSSNSTPLFTTSYFTPVSASVLIPRSVSTADASTLTDSSSRSPPFRIEIFADNDEAYIP